MNQKFSQEALVLVYNQKAQWAEIQFLNAVDQLFAAQKEIENLKLSLDEKNKQIAELNKDK